MLDVVWSSNRLLLLPARGRGNIVGIVQLRNARNCQMVERKRELRETERIVIEKEMTGWSCGKVCEVESRNSMQLFRTSVGFACAV